MFATMKKAIQNLDLRTPENVALAEHPRPKLDGYSLVKKSVDSAADQYLAEYSELATVIGIMPPDLGIESFKALLAKLNFPIFDLHEVIRYMDNKAAQESKEKAGWEWRPLREKDDRQMRFGREFERPDGRYSPPRLGVPASDYYFGPRSVTRHFINDQGGGQTSTQTFDQKGSHKVYDRTIPLHAVRRIAAIEKEFTGDVAFFVSDYALLPSVLYPDPFLMAVIPNVNVANGVGRFVIDFWDEPGFGIEQMLKASGSES